MRSAAFVLFGCLIAATAARAIPGDKLYTQDSAVDVYQEPSEDAPTLVILDEGRMVVEIKRQGSWVKVGVYRISASGAVTGFIGNQGWVQSYLLGPRSPGSDAGTAVAAGEAGAELEESDESDVGTEFVLEFSGDPARAFRASCRIITNAGNLTRRRFSAFTPAAFSFVARAVSCTAARSRRDASRFVVTLDARPGGRVSCVHNPAGPIRCATRGSRQADAIRVGKRVDVKGGIWRPSSGPGIRVLSTNFEMLYRQARRQGGTN